MMVLFGVILSLISNDCLDVIKLSIRTDACPARSVLFCWILLFLDQSLSTLIINMLKVINVGKSYKREDNMLHNEGLEKRRFINLLRGV